MPFEVVLFDLDGTLVDSLPDIAGALNQALAGVGLAPFPLETVRGLVGEGVHRLAEKALALRSAQNVPPADLAARIVATYQGDPLGRTQLYAGVPEMLDALHRRGIPLAVLTNKPGDVARALIRALRLSDIFVAIIGDGDGHPRKPSPDGALALFRQLDVHPSRALMVGDGLPDLALARAARCPVAAAAWGYTDPAVLEASHPDYLLRAPADLLSLV